MLLKKNTSGYIGKVQKNIISSFQSAHHVDRHSSGESREFNSEYDKQLFYTVRVQCAWRRRMARTLYMALKQEKRCKKYQAEMSKGVQLECKACAAGSSEAEQKHLVARRAFHKIESLLFQNQHRMTIYDSGDNWNARFQEALEMPEDNEIQRREKLHALCSVNHDFVAAAVTYGRTIISEYFLHVKDQSVRPTNVGGIAGGKKYLWRGILFKLADGSTGPWTGSDEAAAKAAGHDLRGATTYYHTKVPGLHFALMALIDYKGFRMTAQAWLPLHCLKMGSADGGVTIVDSHDQNLTKKIKKTAEMLNIKTHYVGKQGNNLMPFACDMEAHQGLDGRHYLLDFGRFMPPECPTTMTHLSHIISDGSKVKVHRGNGEYSNGIVQSVKDFGTRYDIFFSNGKECKNVPANQIRDEKLSVFWRLLRPEFVKHRGRQLWEELGLPWPPSNRDILSLEEQEGSGVKNLDSILVMKGMHDLGEGDFVPEQPASDECEDEGYNYFSPEADSPCRTPPQPGSPTRKSSIFGLEDQPWKHFCQPLSPDAFSMFSRFDPEFTQRNMEVELASVFLVHGLIPKLALHLSVISERTPQKILEMNLATELHRFGVNMRHCGLLRALIPDVRSNRCIRDKLLIEVVARTLKNLLKDFQRKWMKSEQSTSEQGMNVLIISFLNLVTGAHPSSDEFWDQRVVTGIMQRFGHVGLTNWERKNMKSLMASPSRLKHLIQTLLHMTGIQLDSTAHNQFLKDTDPTGFEFVVHDIHQVVPLVKYMHVIDFHEGELLSMEVAQQREKLKGENIQSRRERLIWRLQSMASQSYLHAYNSMPDSEETKTKYLASAMQEKTSDNVNWSTAKLKRRHSVADSSSLQSNKPLIKLLEDSDNDSAFTPVNSKIKGSASKKYSHPPRMASLKYLQMTPIRSDLKEDQSAFMRSSHIVSPIIRKVSIEELKRFKSKKSFFDESEC